VKRLEELSQFLISKVSSSYKRFLFYRIDLDSRFIGIVGPRGVGKSTLMLQLGSDKLGNTDEILYLRMDDPTFTGRALFDVAQEFARAGGNYLLLDELHQYPEAHQEMLRIKNEIDGLRVVFTCSSAGNEEGLIYDLSRFSSLYYLPVLSYREYLSFRHGLDFPIIGFDELLEYNRLPGAPVLNRIKPLRYFNEYLKKGSYPWSEEADEIYLQRVRDEIHSSLTEDIMAIWRMDFDSLKKIMTILSQIAEVGPLKPNIEHMARLAGTTRDSLLKFLKYLHKAGIVGLLSGGHEDINYMNKPDRLYLNNACLVSALAMETPDPLALCETFALNQLRQAHQINLDPENAFLVDLKYRMILMPEDIPGRSNDQYTYYINSKIESRIGNQIPLWMIGFLY
jgi:predicted AAA+ superfamily ATPase